MLKKVNSREKAKKETAQEKNSKFRSVLTREPKRSAQEKCQREESKRRAQ